MKSGHIVHVSILLKRSRRGDSVSKVTRFLKNPDVARNDGEEDECTPPSRRKM